VARERWTEDEGRRIVAAWRASGQSKASFCRANGITQNRLDYWCERTSEANNTGATTLIPVRVREGDVRGAVVRVSGGGVSAEVYDASRVDPRWLAALIDAARTSES